MWPLGNVLIPTSIGGHKNNDTIRSLASCLRHLDGKSSEDGGIDRGTSDSICGLCGASLYL